MQFAQCCDNETPEAFASREQKVMGTSDSYTGAWRALTTKALDVGEASLVAERISHWKYRKPELTRKNSRWMMDVAVAGGMGPIADNHKTHWEDSPSWSCRRSTAVRWMWAVHVCHCCFCTSGAVEVRAGLLSRNLSAGIVE
jgi:hypothetical protein